MAEDNELHAAAKRGDLVQVQQSLDSYDINAKGEDDETALVKAAREGHVEVVQLLLSFNADVNIPNVSTRKLKPLCTCRILSIYLTSVHFGHSFCSISCYIKLLCSLLQ